MRIFLFFRKPGHGQQPGLSMSITFRSFFLIYTSYTVHTYMDSSVTSLVPHPVYIHIDSYNHHMQSNIHRLRLPHPYCQLLYPCIRIHIHIKKKKRQKYQWKARAATTHVPFSLPFLFHGVTLYVFTYIKKHNTHIYQIQHICTYISVMCAQGERARTCCVEYTEPSVVLLCAFVHVCMFVRACVCMRE